MMPENRKVINARLPGYKELQQISLNQESIIEEIAPMSYPATTISDKANILDVEKAWISLGAVDLQINGGLGLAFPELQSKHIPLLQKICEFFWEQGVDAFLPTIVTTSVANIRRSLSVIDDFIAIQSDEKTSSAKILGVHLEGPFLNDEKRGAHAAEYLLTPTLERVQWLLGEYTHIIKIVTLAPELDLTEEVIPYLRSRGIIVSLGHSQASAEEAQKAFKLGASMVTHAFNAMPPLHHRQPGLLGTAMIDPQVHCGLVADGQHVCPMMIELLLRTSHYEQGIFLVSDALAPIGLPDGIYPWDNRQIEVKAGTARLANGILAGTTLPLLVGLENLLKWGICDLGTAIALATESPRKAIGLAGISAGQPANLIRWHWDGANSQLTWRRLEF